MKKILLFLALISISISAPVSAQEKDSCKAFCSADKKACRHKADQKAQDHIDPMLHSDDKLSNNPEQDRLARFNERKARKNESSQLKAEILQACDKAYMQCLNTCAQDSLNKEK